MWFLLACTSGTPPEDSEPADSPDGTGEDYSDLRWLDVAIGYEVTCGVLTDGRLACWESNFSTQGLAPGYDALIDPPPGRSWRWVELAPPSNADRSTPNACAIDVEGQACCWGSTFGDECGRDIVPPVTFTKVVLGAQFACGVTPDANLVCWGPGPGSPWTLASDVIDVSSRGGMTVLALHGDASVSFWSGWDEPGEPRYVNRTFADFELPELQLLENNYECAVVISTGEVLCGPFAPEYESLDDGMRSVVSYEVGDRTKQVVGDPVDGTICALGHDGSLFCDEDAYSGYPGDVATDADVITYHTYGIRFDGELFWWGGAARGPSDVHFGE
jgi:hypothetical protein